MKNNETFNTIYNNLFSGAQYTHETHAGLDCALSYDSATGFLFFRVNPDNGYGRAKMSRALLSDILENVFQETPESFIKYYRARKYFLFDIA